MKKRNLLLLVFILGLGFFIFNSEESKPTLTQKDSPEKLSIENRAPTSTENKKTISTPTQKKTLSSIVNNKIPKIAPNELKERWSHQSNFEDDAYIDTQLHLDGKPLEGYFFKWSKNNLGEVGELVSGAMPTIEKVNGAFPAPSELQQIVNDALDPDTEILSTQEVWNLNSNRVLTPQAKVEVKTKSRSQRSSGHEYWFISLNSGKVVKRVEADRH